MRDQMLFGETQSGQPMFTTVAGTRPDGGTPCHGLFGTRLLPKDGETPKPGIHPDKLSQGLF
ncbi:MAG: hypothetical protein M3N39_03275 [Pseudomonadota bacterium]|nr:hypothetical protein [Pseudomonadota bacterium]